MLAEGPFGLGDRVGVGLLNGLFLLAAVMIGINIGNRKRYVQALIDRAHQLAREREQQAQLAAAAERARIAREMHDIVAHSLSVVVTLSEAAAVAIETQPAAAKQALERSAETGRAALTEMRRLLGVLNGGGDAGSEFAPQPGLAQMPALVGGFAEAGLSVALTEQGVPAGDPTQQLAVYRIVQEALTNALRHAGPGATVEVELAHAPDGTRIVVTDSGRVVEQPTAESVPPALPGSGRGLAGARQRARMFGGDVEAGPSGLGWRVIATVPVSEGAGPAADRTASAPTTVREDL
jgi:signal transduction histidine kinase